ncbi:MAG: phosphate ABC transporter substrate-binding protein PstS [Gemmatimonadetes bacterium]|nr:phosphate ABC transporter substrate-binding protein PstS [Gemmatimonadota bacterium]MCA9761778.1 phosphate ABC transporter substrate-binding protein PstS [Gemmatimonadota bacterium]MCB9505891.1 phosphate ABC transporter substrate-binding protein PstS [Gemmatimonadales bacterium]HPF61238.1 phosphate ABC transporter substrate-binding protein PstS [Gemmatimonadales bacterium]HRX19912.1 phosphate ABC transporter substrate-binding protein PstS [Gemmatimonadales bacterium]
MSVTEPATRPLRSLFLAVAVGGALACGGGGGDAGGPVALTGAGATFPNPVYSKWFDAFYRATGNQINYQSVGSGAGVKQYTQGTVDFGATDGPMTDEEIAAVDGQVLHIPTVLGAVVLTWNLPGLDALQLDGTTVADIFLGRITRWNDPRIAELNPGAALPDRDILVVHRSDGSGTSFIFTDYLAKVSTDWQDSVGVGKSVNWPTGLGGKGNEGVTQQIKQVEGTLGYVELVYAAENGLPTATLRNAAGEFVAPTLASVTAAAAGADFGPDTDFRVSITDAPGAGAYPISSFTWLLIRPDMADAAKATAIRDFLRWMVGAEAQQMAADLQYAPLPAPVVTLVESRIGTLTGAGAPLE